MNHANLKAHCERDLIETSWHTWIWELYSICGERHRWIDAMCAVCTPLLPYYERAFSAGRRPRRAFELANAPHWGRAEQAEVQKIKGWFERRELQHIMRRGIHGHLMTAALWTLRIRLAADVNLHGPKTQPPSFTSSKSYNLDDWFYCAYIASLYASNTRAKMLRARPYPPKYSIALAHARREAQGIFYQAFCREMDR